MLNTFAKLLYDKKGYSIIEVPIAIILILALFMGMVFFTNAYRYHLIMQMAAKEGARTMKATLDSGRAVEKTNNELLLGRIDADVSIVDGKIVVSKNYGFYIPSMNRHLFNLKASVDFHDEVDLIYYDGYR